MDSSADEKRRSFEAEALPHLDAVYRFARSLTRDAERAEDLAQ
jgi:DNA-directed RNA polymerase specialized sigma24 family protein